MPDMSKRINLTLPDAIYDDLEYWAKREGRAIANLANFLLEVALREAKVRGDFPPKDAQQNDQQTTGTTGGKRRGKAGE
jgi:hypothetical protein